MDIPKPRLTLPNARNQGLSTTQPDTSIASTSATKQAAEQLASHVATYAPLSPTPADQECSGSESDLELEPDMAATYVNHFINNKPTEEVKINKLLWCFGHLIPETQDENKQDTYNKPIAALEKNTVSTQIDGHTYKISSAIDLVFMVLGGRTNPISEDLELWKKRNSPACVSQV